VGRRCLVLLILRPSTFRLHSSTPLAAAGPLRTIQQGPAALAALRRPAKNAARLKTPACRRNADSGPVSASGGFLAREA